MDPANVLLALEEQKKWRERRRRLQDRIRQLTRRRLSLERELEGVRRKVSEYDRLLAGLKEQILERKPIPPIIQGR
jgi:chromosome segregation ATPase